MKNKDIIIMAIETSCDETSASVVKNGHHVLSNVIFSQINIHEKYGGVVPEIASRNHMNDISLVIDKALKSASMKIDDVDAIAVTYGPGLIGALLVGVSYAKSLAFALKKPLIGVHHIEGHICSNYITDCNFSPPYICLVVSGGHTSIVFVHRYGTYEILGKTLDDAVGEAYDKVARTLGLGYPGGPKIDKLSKKGHKFAINFPRVYLEKNSLDFSFSGLKSSVINYLNKNENKNVTINDIAASFQQSVIDVLVSKTINACKIKGINKIAMVGGVSCNEGLRELMKTACDENNFELNVQLPLYCTDNAAMIGAAAYFHYINADLKYFDLNACPNLILKNY